MVRPALERRLEDDALVVALAHALRLDAVCAGRSLLSTLDPPLATGETACFGPLPHLGVRRGTGARSGGW